MTWKRMAVIGISTLALATGGPGVVRADLITNGNFTQYTGGYTGGGYTNAPSQIDNSATGGYTNLTGWTVANAGLSDPTDAFYAYSFLYTSSTVNTVGSWFPSANAFLKFLPTVAPAPDGGNFVSLDGYSQNNTLSQTITGLTVGQQYTLSFNWAAAQDATANNVPYSDQVDVSFGSSTQSTANTGLLDYGSFFAWTPVTMTFTADSTSDVLSFLADGTPYGGPPDVLLDNIQLTAAAVPEPSTLVLSSIVTVGFIAVGLHRRARAAKAAAF
jgi:hypothetical protein